LEALKSRKKKIKESVDELKGKLTTVNEGLGKLDEADKKRKQDKIEADQKRASELKSKLDGAQKNLKTKRAALDELRGKLANARSVTEKDALQTQLD